MINRALEIIHDILAKHDSRIKRLEANQTLTVIVKTDTGDPSVVGNGILVINEFDNNVKLYADGAWRTLVSW